MVLLPAKERRGCDERVSEGELVDHNPPAMAEAPSQASYSSIEQHERAEGLAAGVRAGTGVASTSGRKSRGKACRCPLGGFPFFHFFFSFFFFISMFRGLGIGD